MPAVRIFQSTLPQGERLYVATNSSICIDFNPRSRKGSDVGCQYASGPFSYFNPRSRKGSDFLADSPPVDLFLFQSTLPQGERRLYFCRHGQYFRISIHAPARGATSLVCFDSLFQEISIHAPARGATAIITNFHTQLLFKITIFSYIASPLSFPSSLFPDI